MRVPFIVFAEAAPAIEPPERPLADPSPGHGHEPTRDVGPLHHLEIQTERFFGLGYELPGTCAVHPDGLKRGMFSMHLLEEGYSTTAVLNTRRGDSNRKDESEHIGDHMALSPLYLLPCVEATRTAGLRSLDALAV